MFFHLFQMIPFRCMWTPHDRNTFKLRLSPPSPHPPVYFPFIFLQPVIPPLLSLIILAPASTPALSAQGKVAQTACMSACKHLSTSMMQMLLDTELKQISMGAIQQFNLDVIQCERKLTRLRRKAKIHQRGMRVGVALGVARWWQGGVCCLLSSVFASSEPVPGFQGDTLQLAFIDLRQVNLLTVHMENLQSTLFLTVL